MIIKNIYKNCNLRKRRIYIQKKRQFRILIRIVSPINFKPVVLLLLVLNWPLLMDRDGGCCVPETLLVVVVVDGGCGGVKEIRSRSMDITITITMMTMKMMIKK